MSASSLGPPVQLPTTEQEAEKNATLNQIRTLCVCVVFVSLKNTQYKILRHMKNQENVTHNQEKESTEVDLQMTQMLEMTNKVFSHFKYTYPICNL